jgi:hypothetical protein
MNRESQFFLESKISAPILPRILKHKINLKRLQVRETLRGPVYINILTHFVTNFRRYL